MMRLSRNLRRFRWLVFASWLLALVPAIYIVLTQSGNLTGGGFDVAGSQSLLVHDQLEAQYHDQGASSLALVAAPRADARTYASIDHLRGRSPNITPSRPCSAKIDTGRLDTGQLMPIVVVVHQRRIDQVVEIHVRDIFFRGHCTDCRLPVAVGFICQR